MFRINTFLTLAAIVFRLMTASTTATADEVTVKFVPLPDRPAPPLSLRLPPLARLEGIDDTGETWRQTGEMPTAYLSALQDMQKCLRQQEWKLIQQVPFRSETGKRRNLMTWQHKHERILVLVSELAADKTGLAWGILNEKGEKLTPKG